ncbi:MAG: hypothetical protein AMS25_12490 [Gemmatimonas sp. SM23_52]|nr:MAG: hypothetical protein AMS25_12490 [Gemmatimonas sp. SM23_52]
MLAVRQVVVSLLFYITAGLLLPAGALSQSQAEQRQRRDDPQSDIDPRRILSQARRSQERFELVRRYHFPKGYARTGECDERIGRLCMWHQRGDDEIPEEPSEVREARKRLILDLEEAAVVLPADDWITGQLVKYLVEDGRADAAYDAARRCLPASDWWCSALTGYALHKRGQYEAAEAAFADALAAMDPEQRCRWRDISLLIAGDLARDYRRRSCRERETIERRVWWLADPLYLYPGNDRLTEQLARQVQIQMQEDAAPPFEIAWGSDLREVVLRYGWPTHFEQAQSFGVRTIGQLPTVIHHHPDGRTFVPPPAAAEGLGNVGAEGWPLLPAKPRSEYAPAYAEFDSVTEHQLALFRRGDSAIVVAAVEIDREGGWGAGPVQAALFVAHDERSAPARSTVTMTSEEKAVLTVTVAAEPAIASLELLSADAKKAGRARYGIRPPATPRTVLAISDILVLDEPAVLPSYLTQALPHTRGLLQARGNERIALYWELYGLQPQGEHLRMSLTLTRKGSNLFRTITDWIGIASEDRPLSLDWEEAVDRRYAATPRSLTVELPKMDKGTYALELQVSACGREPVIASREVVVRE